MSGSSLLVCGGAWPPARTASRHESAPSVLAMVTFACFVVFAWAIVKITKDMVTWIFN
jgi:hypothetical protein